MIYELGHHSIDVAFSFVRIARIYITFGSTDSAIVYYARTLPIWRAIAHRAGEATTLNEIGVAHHSLGRTDSALVYLTRALPLRRQSGSRSGEALTLFNIGAAYSSLGPADSAVAYYAQARSIRRELGHRAEEASALESIGRVLSNSGRPDAALSNYFEALPIYRDLQDRSAEANTLNQIGAVHRDLGRPDSALAYYALAIEIRRAVGDLKGEAQSLNNIGAVQSDLGRADSALAYYSLAIPILRTVGNLSGEAATWGNIGTVQFRLGRPDSALVYYAQSLRITRDIRDRAGEATTLNNLGVVHSRLGASELALVHFTRALAIEREIGDDEATTLSNIGLLQSRLERPDSALMYHRQALAIQARVGDRAGEATSLNNIGTVQDDIGHPGDALTYYRRALVIHRAVGNIEGQAIALDNIGNFFLLSVGSNDPRPAAAAFDSAAALHARVRRRAGGDANAVSVSETASGTFTSWSRAWVAVAEGAAVAGDGAVAAHAMSSSLAAADRGRAQALRDLLERGAGAGVAAGVDAADTIAGADLAAEAIRLLAPLRESRTALLYYLTHGDTLRAWFLGTDGALRILSPVVQQRAELIDRIGAARAQIGADEAAARRRRGEAPPAVQRDVLGVNVGADLDPAASVAALLALSASVLPAGLETLLAPGAELVIVPNGALGQVPFAALTLPEDTLPLGLRNAIRYAPSLRALLAARGADELDPGTDTVHLRALVVGNPDMPHVRAQDGTVRKLSPLAGAASEGAWVATRLGVPLLTGTAATERTVRDMMPAASIIHLATHGLAYGTEATVRDSYVALTPGVGHDGFFTLGELLDDDSIQLSADLIVLSACQTGLGEAREAEGTVGLQRGLLAKGARSVLVSLWSVDDAATQLLMERFYTHWLGTQNRPVIGKAEALRRAQADVRALPSFYNPRYWASFQLVGLQ